VWAWERCRISPPRFLAECCKRQLNQGSFVLLYFRLSPFSDLYCVCLSVFSCTVLFVSISQVIGCELVKTASEMTYTVSGGALNSTPTDMLTLLVCGRVHLTVRCPSVCPTYRPLCATAAGLLLCARRAGDMGRSRRAPQQHGVQQLMRAVSRCQLTYEAEHRLVLCVNMEYGVTSENSSVHCPPGSPVAASTGCVFC